MILFTGSGEVFGDDIGASLEYYLWQTKVSVPTLRNRVVDQINVYMPELVSLGYELDVYIYEGTVRDIMFLDFIIKGYNIEFIFE